MKARIGVAEGREFEIEADDDFPQQVEAAFGTEGGGVLWVTDLKHNRVAIPTRRVTYVVIETDEGRVHVGF